MTGIATVPTRLGALTFGGRPDEAAYDALRSAELDLWWNLAPELDDLLPRMQECAAEVLLAHIEDGAAPTDVPDFADQLDRVCVLLGCGGRVHVSSSAGCGRTGLAVACVRMLLEEEDPHAALAAAFEACGGPELDTQRAFVIELHRALRAV